MTERRIILSLSALFLVLAVITIATLLPYGGRPSALFHTDERMTGIVTFPPEFVMLDAPGYDGMFYYVMARNFPEFLSSSEWPSLRESPVTAYSYQRILLPVLAATLSFGNDVALPWAFLAINLSAILGCAFLILRHDRSATLAAIALALCPAALVGLHFSLAEPLSLLLITWFLVRFVARGTKETNVTDMLLLSLAVLTREINFIFVVGVCGYLLLQKRWHSAALTLIPVAVFMALHGWIYTVFGEVPFLFSAEKSGFPFEGVIVTLREALAGNVKAISAASLLFGFVLPALWLAVRDIIKERKLTFVTTGLAGFLILMLLMADHIWSSMTSIGRVITPVYPLFAMYAIVHRNRMTDALLLILIVLGLSIAIVLSQIVHPFTLLP